MAKRWYPTMPRYTTPVIVQRSHDGPSSRIGNQRTGSNVARLLKRFDTTSIARVDAPSVDPPATHEAPPSTYATDWEAWWGTPPSTSTNPYRIPDPPVIDRPLLPTPDAPVLWEAFATVGSGRLDWGLRVSAIYAMVEWKPQTGSEKMSGMRDLSINEAAIKMRPSIIVQAGITTKEWSVVRVADSTEWKLESIVPSFRREEFVELMVERVE